MALNHDDKEKAFNEIETKNSERPVKNVCVITGGGSGMGLATAKVMGESHYIIISGRTVSKLEHAIDELKLMGIEAEAFPCDVSKREDVVALAHRAMAIGDVEVVIHAAGMSPTMADAQKIMAVNALGTIHVNEIFYDVMSEGGCLIDVSSMSAYFMPKAILPMKAFKLSRVDKKLFMAKMMKRVNLFPKKMRSQIAYGMSKAFVVWYAKTDAGKFGERHLRVLSISPGSFETPMGDAEKDNLQEYIESSALKRLGDVEEIAFLMAACADKRAGYLTGVDILCDGGCVASGVGSIKAKLS
ncbi:SDR family oxidoreductase [Fusibacter paucivorans]|uniref:SDR family oxidoreductase n=1 Tax=Fusibacter paucivorans TaxID=76009 RepID=A0ABS5PTB7_9FIRM|nr:SDR family oxidoreductase [Fusibacter paucivorans]MBS7528326.1 SDR family oxidoreductase [Fusibacter paucivorans]